ncbi:MAG: tubulin-like doman-containing protein, partial [Prevotella sp.]|nr:tubulin-like doman-containing protein [Prevotella sp.]
SYCNTNHILIGLGGTGGKILRAFKMRMFEEFPDVKEREKQSVSLLYVDSTKEMMPKDGRPRADFRVMGQDASFTNDEFLFIKGNDVGHVLDHIDNYPSVKGIVQNASAVKSAIGNLGEAAGQMRRAGRLLFASNAVAFVNALQNAFARCSSKSGNQSALYIHIFAGLSGGTGSGSIIDAIVQARKLYKDAVISVYAMVPEMNLPKANMDQGRYYQNGYAAINELNALQAGRYVPHDVTGAGAQADVWSAKVHGVADGITLYSNVNDNGQSINSLEELPKVVSDYVFARVFLINAQNKVCEDIIRGYNFENMNNFEVEYDELGDVSDGNAEPLIARTKKVNSFGIKRVMYPELRVLKHITYTVGESILLQFKYNNWREDMGFVNEEANKDYRELYLNDKNLQKWMLDDDHLTLDTKILPNDKDHPSIDTYWHDKALGYANDESVKKASCPLNELDSLLGEEFYAKQFRGVGVETYYRDKVKAIPDMVREIRHGIEQELYERWESGDISIVELQKVSKLLIEKVTEIRTHIE